MGLCIIWIILALLYTLSGIVKKAVPAATAFVDPTIFPLFIFIDAFLGSIYSDVDYWKMPPVFFRFEAASLTESIEETLFNLLLVGVWIIEGSRESFPMRRLLCYGVCA